MTMRLIRSDPALGSAARASKSVIRELGGEKVDVIAWSEDLQTYLSASLSPATVAHVETIDEEHLAVISVTADQLSLAIGKGGQNVRLAAKLTGWKITIKGEEGKVVADSEIGEIVSNETEADDIAAETALASSEEAPAEKVKAPKGKKKSSSAKAAGDKEVMTEEASVDASADAMGDEAKVGDATVLDEHGERAERADEADGK